MSDTGLTSDTGTDQMADALQQAADELENLAAENERIAEAFEENGWTGFDGLGSARIALASARENLTEVGNKIGVGGAAVRDARLNNQMATHATSTSLGRT